MFAIAGASCRHHFLSTLQVHQNIHQFGTSLENLGIGCVASLRVNHRRQFAGKIDCRLFQRARNDFAQAIRAIGEPIHQRSADQISMAKLLTLLFEVTGLFDMRTRTELVMLQKTMVVVEGVSRSLDPHLNMWTTAEPVVREWIEKNLGPIGRIQDLGRNAASFAGMLAHLPAIASRAETLGARIEEAADKGFPLDERSIAAIGRAEAKRARWGNLALWIIAITLALIAARLI